MKRSSVQFAALVEPLTLVAALLIGPSSSGASQQVVWTNVTPPDMPDFGRVSLIDASAFDAGKASGTFHDGGWWQELSPGLADIPVTDVIPEQDELAMASHGRGFWVLDNVGPLREYRSGVLDWDVVKFEPAVAYRSANGVAISWWVGEGGGSAEEAKLKVLDATGEVVHAIVPAEEGEGRNPRIEGVTDEDLAAQNEFGVRIRDEVGRANRQVIEIRRVQGELGERLAASDDEGLREAGERLRVTLDEVEGEISQVRIRSHLDPLNFPIRVNSRLANLLSMAHRGDGRPGRGMYEVSEVMVGRLGGVLEALDRLWGGELAKANIELGRLGVEGFGGAGCDVLEDSG